MDTKLKTAKIALVLLGSALCGACSFAAATENQDPLFNGPLETSVVATVNALDSATPVPPITLPTATPSPTEPLVSPTPSISPTPTPIWADFPAPARPSSTEIPPPMPEIAFDSNVVNILLLGSDERRGTGGFRTDAMMVVSIDPTEGSATLISIPRDLYVYIPGWRMDRINTAMVRGGFDMARQTILYNLGIPVDGWARMNFAGFIGAIDTLGGITVESAAYMRDECRGEILTYRPGVSYDMDGTEALCYVRMRKSGGDFDRMRRQQEVVRAIFSKLLTINGLARVPQLYNQFYNTFVTDIELSELLPLVPSAVQIGADPSRISHFSVDRDLVDFWRTQGGGSVLLPKRPGVQLMLLEAFGSDAFGSVR
ncbi:MAG: LCP family protein [Anaerolineales bacterium]